MPVLAIKTRAYFIPSLLLRLRHAAANSHYPLHAPTPYEVQQEKSVSFTPENLRTDGRTPQLAVGRPLEGENSDLHVGKIGNPIRLTRLQVRLL